MAIGTIALTLLTPLVRHADRMHEVTRASIDLRCGYWNNSVNVPLVTLLVRHAYGPSYAMRDWLIKALVWTTLSYGAKAWTLKMRNERMIMIASTEMCWMDRKN